MFLTFFQSNFIYNIFEGDAYYVIEVKLVTNKLGFSGYSGVQYKTDVAFIGNTFNKTLMTVKN